jgi:hypothetical protein
MPVELGITGAVKKRALLMIIRLVSTVRQCEVIAGAESANLKHTGTVTTIDTAFGNPKICYQKSLSHRASLSPHKSMVVAFMAPP